MANTAVQFGFTPYGIAAGRSPTFGLRRRSMAYNYGSTLFRGDPVASDANGNVIRVSSQSGVVSGIFWGVEYYDPVQKITFRSKQWSAPTLGSTQVVTAFVYDDPEMLFLAASLGGSRALALTDVMNNVQWQAGSGGNTTSGISSYVVDDAHVTTTNTLPFKIMDLYSTYATPGANGSDNTTVYNWAIVKMNNTDRSVGQTGI